ncbi:hypothetical protein K1719_022981 [Acacia pycnantha]|nr:hypothetical protein K1719_022981 [Acacia pycnantha]
MFTGKGNCEASILIEEVPSQIRAHDARILSSVLEEMKSVFSHPPEGKYYVVDAVNHKDYKKFSIMHIPH